MRASRTPWSLEKLGLDRSDIEDRSDNFLNLLAHTYYDPDVFDFELDAVLVGRWQFFAPLARLAVPGAAVASDADAGTMHGTRASRVRCPSAG